MPVYKRDEIRCNAREKQWCETLRTQRWRVYTKSRELNETSKEDQDVCSVSVCRHRNQTRGQLLWTALGRLSRAEAEAKAITKGCVEGTSANNVLEGDIGETYSLQLWSDNPSARTFSQRLEQCGDSTCQIEACLKSTQTFEEMTTRQPC